MQVFQTVLAAQPCPQAGYSWRESVIEANPHHSIICELANFSTQISNYVAQKI
jgi:hypothetical protein